jgi:lysozyme family protein
MRSNFERSLKWLDISEGGFVNDPDDPGGATNRGVTQATYDAFRRRNGVATQSVRRITDEEVRQIYRRQYWDRVQGDELPSGVDYAVFDFAVNSGVSRAAKHLQALVRVGQDGIIGEITLAAVEAHPDKARLIIDLCASRMRFLRGLSTWWKFGRGWTRRVEGDIPGVQDGDIGVIDRAVRLSQGASVIPAPKPPLPPDAPSGSLWAALVAVIASIFGSMRGKA